MRMRAGGPLGSGKQWMSWVHRDDLLELLIAALGDASYSGVYNATAPKPVRMSELCSALGGCRLRCAVLVALGCAACAVLRAKGPVCAPQ